MIDTKKYIQKLKTELVMHGYVNGWLLKWYRSKIKELEAKIKNNS